MVCGLRASPVNVEMVLGAQLYHVSWLGQLRFIVGKSKTLQLSQPLTPQLFLCFTHPFYLFSPSHLSKMDMAIVFILLTLSP